MQYDYLLEENTQMKKALISSKAIIERKLNELETQIAINDEIRQQLDKTKQESYEMQQKIKLLTQERKQIESQFDTTTKNWKLLIEQKQREIEEIQSKLIPTFDQDMMRIKIINELEIPHRQQMEVKHQEIEKLNETVYQLKRRVDLEIAKGETITLESKKENKLLQERHALEIQDMNHQLTELTKLLEDNKDKEMLRRIRKDLDEYKQKSTVLDTENEELRIERDKIREEKNEMMIKFSRQIDSERNDKRQFKAESDKLTVRVRFLDEELRKEKQRRDQLVTEFELLKSEKEQQNTDIRKKDDQIHYLQRKITEMEEEQLENEQKMQDKLSRLYNDEHDKYLQERNKAVTMQKDFDNIKKRYGDLSDDYKILKDRYLKESTDQRDHVKELNEEIEKLKKNTTFQGKDIADLERTSKLREEQIHDIENENETLKRRNRELQHRIQLIEINPIPPQQYQQPQIIQPVPVVEQVQKISEVEKKENKVSNQSLQQITEENRELLSKCKKLQKKLKQANDKILELQMRNTILEKQLQKHHLQLETGPQTHSESPFRPHQDNFETRNIQQYQQQQQQQQQQQSKSDFGTEQYPKPRNNSSNKRQLPAFIQPGNARPNNFTDIHDDELLNKVIMLTEASQRQQYW